MRKLLPALLIALVVIALVVIAALRPEWLKLGWMWLIGLGGVLWGGLRKLLDMLTGDRKLDEIEKRNEELRLELETLRTQALTADQQLAAERARYQEELRQLNGRLAAEQVHYQAVDAELQRIRQMNYEEYFNALPQDEQERIKEEIWDRVDFGL